VKALPLPARLFVVAVVAVGAALLATLFPIEGFGSHLKLFVVLLVLSSATSIFKVTLPLPRSGSTLSISYAVDLAALLLLGVEPAVLIAAVSAWSQCTFRGKERNPLHQTLFSVASLIITVRVAGLVALEPSPVRRRRTSRRTRFS
jgi:hypothetical protein